MTSFIIYNTLLKKPVMVVLDTDNPSDPAWNPSDCIQIPINDEDYKTMSSDDLLIYINNAVNGIT